MKKLLSTISIIGLVTTGVLLAAGSSDNDYKIGTASSSANKTVTFDTGDTSNNPNIMVNDGRDISFINNQSTKFKIGNGGDLTLGGTTDTSNTHTMYGRKFNFVWNSASGGEEVSFVNSNTGGNATARIILQTSNSATAASDPFITFITNGSSNGFFAMGIDNDDSDNFKINYGTTSISGNTQIALGISPSTGSVSLPLPLTVGGTGSTPFFQSAAAIRLYDNQTLTGAAQYGLLNTATFTTAATTSMIGVYSQVQSSAGSYTTPINANFYAWAMAKGASHVMTRSINYMGDNQTVATNNCFMCDGTAFSGDWGINLQTSRANYLGGSLTVGGAIVAGSFSFGGNDFKVNAGATAAQNGSFAQGANTGSVTFSGGTGVDSARNIQAYGGSHATKAMYLEFKRNSTIDGQVDGSGAWQIGSSGSGSTQTIHGALSVNPAGNIALLHTIKGRFLTLDYDAGGANSSGLILNNDDASSAATSFAQIISNGGDAGVHVNDDAGAGTGFVFGKDSTSNNLVIGPGTFPIGSSNTITMGTGGQLTMGSNQAFVIETSPGPSSGFAYIRSNNGGLNRFLIENSSNTASSDANIIINSGGSSAGDPYLTFQVIGAQQFAIGIDNSDSDKFKISQSSVLGTSDALAIGSGGEFTIGSPTFANQPNVIKGPNANVTSTGLSLDCGSAACATAIHGARNDGVMYIGANAGVSSGPLLTLYGSTNASLPNVAKLSSGGANVSSIIMFTSAAGANIALGGGVELTDTRVHAYGDNTGNTNAAQKIFRVYGNGWGTSSATSALTMLYIDGSTNSAPTFTTAYYSGITLKALTKGTNHTITDLVGLAVEDQTETVTRFKANFSIGNNGSSPGSPGAAESGPYNIYVQPNKPSFFNGSLRVGPTSTGAGSTYPNSFIRNSATEGALYVGQDNTGASSQSLVVVTAATTGSGNAFSVFNNNGGSNADRILYVANDATIFLGKTNATAHVLTYGTHTASGNFYAGTVATSSANAIFRGGDTAVTSGGSQFGFVDTHVFSSSATTSIYGYAAIFATQNAAFTTPVVYDFFAETPTKGASHTVTRFANYGGTVSSTGVNNAFLTDNASYSSDWMINFTSNRPSLFSGDLTLAARNFNHQKSDSGNLVYHSVANLSNTASSGAMILVGTAGSSAGSPVVRYEISGVQNWVQGVDNADSDKYKIVEGTDIAVGANTKIQCTTGGAGHCESKGSAGTTDATAGYLGEAARSAVTTLTNFTGTATWKDCTSISLAAGDWDVNGVGQFALSGATASGTYQAAVSVNSGTTTTDHVDGDNVNSGTRPTATERATQVIPGYRIKVSSTTTVYMKVFATYSAGTPQYVCRISARRVR